MHNGTVCVLIIKMIMLLGFQLLCMHVWACLDTLISR